MMGVLGRVVALRVTAKGCEAVQGSSVLPVAGIVDVGEGRCATVTGSQLSFHTIIVALFV